MKRRKMGKGVLCLATLVTLFLGCRQEYTPKPRAYFRISQPQKEYKVTGNNCPWISEIPVYSVLQKNKVDERANSGDCWQTWYFPQFKGEVFLTYKEISSEQPLEDLLQNMHELTYKHQIKANLIQSSSKWDSTHNKLMVLYTLEGNVASPIQFCITDSSKHYVRGALYFRATPNSDSIAPIKKFVQADIEHFIEKLRWN